MLTHVDLFSGIGGFSLAAEWAGFRTVCFCEIDDYCQKVLRKHWPGVPIWDDIKTFKWPLENAPGLGRARRGKGNEAGNKGILQTPRPCSPDELEPITLLTGGFPCQPFSVAGKRRGKADDRDLWPDMFRVIQEVRPAWVVGENVAGFVKMELDRSISDLESAGYAVQAFVIPACAVDAKHRRDRVWIVAHSSRQRRRGWRDGDEARNERILQAPGSCPSDKRQDVADNERHRWNSSAQQELDEKTSRRESGCGLDNICRWSVEPDMGRVAHGVPSGMDGDLNGQKELRILPQGNDKTAMEKRQSRQHLEQEAILFNSVLRGLDNQSESDQESERKETSVSQIQGRNMPSMSEQNSSSTSSSGRQSFEQRKRQYSNSMSEMPQERTFEKWDMGNLWIQEPNILRVATGVKNRVSRLKCLGNAIVPQVALEIIRCIAEIENEIKKNGD